jgi:indole-3-glycerol phosphate synthase
VEVHDGDELERALRCGARLVGVNNRDLKTFKVDLGTTEYLAKHLFAASESTPRILVGESGIHSRADAVRLREAGCSAILVGESLMKSGSIPAKVAELIGV